MNDLFTLVYAELRRIAGRQLRGERSGHTLCTTALVHEAWLRLGGDDQRAALPEAMARYITTDLEHVRYRGF